jgi:tRNA threonylcarbamoyladenosine dehydratase
VHTLPSEFAQVHLLASCHSRGLPVLCVGGAGAKADPTKLRFADISEASFDPLVRSVRHQLRVRHAVTTGVHVLLSMEKPRCGLVTTAEQAAAPSLHDYQARSRCWLCDDGMSLVATAHV